MNFGGPRPFDALDERQPAWRSRVGTNMRQEADRQADGEACHEPRGQLAELMIGAFTGLDVGLGGEVAEQLGGLPTAGSEATAGRDRPGNQTCDRDAVAAGAV